MGVLALFSVMYDFTGRGLCSKMLINCFTTWGSEGRVGGG